jgi:hypothetical protein
MEVTVRTNADEWIERRELSLLAAYAPGELLPVREPDAYQGQTHIPGFFWMSRLRRLVWYESRLEMVALKMLDFDPLLVDVLPQPFILHYRVDGKAYRHIPDYLVWRSKEPHRHVVNVKPRKSVDKPTNQRAFTACAEACSALNWSYTTQSEPPRVFLANLNWLAGYRRKPPGFAALCERMIESAATQPTIDELLAGIGEDAARARPILFYLIWNRMLEVDMLELLSDSSKVRLTP